MGAWGEEAENSGRGQKWSLGAQEKEAPLWAPGREGGKLSLLEKELGAAALLLALWPWTSCLPGSDSHSLRIAGDDAISFICKRGVITVQPSYGCNALMSARSSAQHLAVHGTCSVNTGFYCYLTGCLIYSRKRCCTPACQCRELRPAGESHSSCHGCSEGTLRHSRLGRHFSDQVTFTLSPCIRKQVPGRGNSMCKAKV